MRTGRTFGHGTKEIQRNISRQGRGAAAVGGESRFSFEEFRCLHQRSCVVMGNARSVPDMEGIGSVELGTLPSLYRSLQTTSILVIATVGPK